MPIRTALITASGYGSRFFPVSKGVQKEMLPVLNRPVLDYLIDDCIRAGITNIIITIREGQNLVRDYYTEQPRLREFFEQMGTIEKYEKVENLHQKATFTFVTQRNEDGYGTAVPVLLARKFLEVEDAFLYLTGDDFTYYPEGNESAAEGLVDTWNRSKAAAVMSCREVEPELISKYGIVETETRENIQYMTSLVEKPALGSTESRLANISKYILTPELFKYMEGQAPDQKTGEMYLTDTLSALAADKPVAVHVPRGEYLDCGSVAGWLKANLRVAQKDSALWHEVQEYLAEISY